MKKILLILLCFCLLCPHIQAASQEKTVALTFDDGPSGRFTRRLLQGLAQRQVVATFLLCGYRMVQYPQLTQQIAAQGHEIGLHGYTHDPMNRMTRQEILQELQRTQALLPDGCQVRFLRPPGGKCSTAVKAVAGQMGLSLLTWSVDPKDWETDDTDRIVQRVVSQVRDGDVILLHDMSDSSVDAALQIVDLLQSKGFRFVTASQLAGMQGISLQPGGVYSRFA